MPLGAPPPLPSAAGPAFVSARPPHSSIPPFKPIELKPFVNANRQVSPHWSVKDYVAVDKLSACIAAVLGIAPPRIDFAETTMEGLSRVMSIPYYADEPTLNPIAWTSPEGKVYMATDAPEYSADDRLDAAKIRSTLVHESMHAASHNHTGFQQMTKEAGINSNWNYDEFTTDYFAHKVYQQLYPDADYKTNYFTKDLGERPKVWGGNLIAFMVQSGHMCEADITSAYANGKGSLVLLEDEKLDAWKQYAKTGNVKALQKHIQ
ncbi:toxin [Burkholderia ubonensis]|nr:toxin [Burkholderia ubonensis]